MSELAIKRVCGVPKHMQLVKLIRRDITRGRLKAGAKLPSVRDLAEEYKTTKVTVGLAMEQLEREGLIERHQGRGNFIKTLRLRVLAVVLDSRITDPNATIYCSRLLARIDKTLESTGWSRKWYIGVSDQATADEFIQAVANRRFDGLIVHSRWVAENYLPQLAQAGIACVGAYPYHALDQWVFFNYRQFSQTGVQALRDVGAKRIALIAGHDPQGIQCQMEEGYRRGLKDSHRPIDEHLVRIVPDTEEDGFRTFNDLWDLPHRPDGIVVTDELIARGVIRGIFTRGVRVPDELKLASQVTLDTLNPFPIPVIQLQTDVAQQADHLVRMILDLTAGQPVAKSRVSLLPKLYNPYERKRES